MNVALMKNLDGVDMDQLAREGWCVVPDVLSPSESQVALRHLWAVADANERAGIDTVFPEVDPNGKNVRVLNLLQSDQYFRDMILHDKALEIVRAIVGSDFLISSFSANIARPGSSPMRLHSDQSVVAPEPWLEPWAVNLIWCLTDAYADNGATRFVPGSHRWRTRADIPADAEERLTPFEAKAGSIVVMDGRLWHTSGANITDDEDRALLFAYYARSFLRPQFNWNAALSAQLQASVSPLLRAHLGLDVLGNGTGNVNTDADTLSRMSTQSASRG